MSTEKSSDRSGDSDVTVACRHCGLPSPPPAHEGEPAFCCSGCRGAYELIHGWGLDDYYALRDRLSTAPADAVVNASRYDELDHPELLGRSAPKPIGDQLLSCRLAVGGLHCGACVWLIERSARLHAGWHSARVRMNDHTVDLVFDASKTKLSEIAGVMDRLGYRVAPLADSSGADRAAAENRSLLMQIAIAGFCAANTMWIAISLYAGRFSGIEAEYANVLRWAGVILGLLAVAVPGRTFFRGAWASIRTRTPHMDLPVALGLGVGAIAGAIGAIRGEGEVYFDSIAVLVFFLLVGRWVQFRQQRRAAESVGLLMRLAPPTANRVEPDGSTKLVPTDALRAGDVVRVAAGEGIPADGEVIEGTTTLDRALMTGESVPVEVTAGENVEAGTANLAAAIDVRVTAVGLDSRVGKLTQLIEDAAANKAPVVQMADAIGGWFVTIVIVLAVVTLIVWSRTDPVAGAQHAVALLIVACPCALALATPLALAVSLGRAAKRKILVRGGDVLERLAKPGVVWFDKTGTLTTGRLELVDILVEPSADWTTERVLELAASVEAGSAHPVAEAILRAADQRALPYQAVDSSQVIGGGVRGTVGGIGIAIGNAGFLTEGGAEIPRWAADQQDALAAQGASSVLVALDNQVTGLIALRDVLRPETRDVVSKLQNRGWQIGMLSGDHPKAVAAMASEAGIATDRAMGGLSPEEKLARIEASQQDGVPVLMVGDGVNDAAALAAADVGVAVRGGAEASLEAAPVFLADGTLNGLTQLIDASRQTVRVIRRNFVASLGYNVVAVILAMSGRINPLVAAVLMPISSLTVLSLTLASRTFRDARNQT